MSENKSKKSIFRSTIIYFIGSVLSKIIVFFLLPIYTKYIPASDMGFYDSAIAVITFFSSVLFLDIGSGIMRFMFERQELTDKNFPIYSGMAIFLSSLALYIVISLVVGFTVTIEYFIWIVLYGFITCLHTVISYIARGWGYNNLYALSGVVGTVVTIASNLLFILVLEWDYKSLYISQCLGVLVSTLVLEIKCKVVLNFRKNYFDKKLFMEMLKFSLPLCINSVAFWLLNSANKVIVTYMLGSDQNGYLAVANKFTSVLYLVSSCFQLAWQELAYSKENKLEATTGEFYTKAFDLYIRVLIAGLLLLIPLINIGLTIYPSFIDQSYSSAISLIPLALAGTIMSILNSFLGSIFGGLKKNSVIFASTLSGAVVNVGLIVGLIYLDVGVMASNIAFLCGFSVAVLIRTIILKKLINLRVKYWYFIVAILLYCGVATVYNYLDWYYNLALFFVLCIVSYFALKTEIKDIFNSINKRIRRKQKENIDKGDIEG